MIYLKRALSITHESHKIVNWLQNINSSYNKLANVEILAIFLDVSILPIVISFILLYFDCIYSSIISFSIFFIGIDLFQEVGLLNSNDKVKRHIKNEKYYISAVLLSGSIIYKIANNDIDLYPYSYKLRNISDINLIVSLLLMIVILILIGRKYSIEIPEYNRCTPKQSTSIILELNLNIVFISLFSFIIYLIIIHPLFSFTWIMIYIIAFEVIRLNDGIHQM